MPNGLAGAAGKLAGNQQVQALVKQLAPVLVQKVKAQLNGGQNGQRNGTRNGAGRRRNTRNQRALARGAALRSLPRGPVQPKDVRFRGGAMSNQYFAPRGQGFYDAFASMPDSAILSSAVGPCTPIEGFARYIVSGGAGVSNIPYQVVTGTATLTANVTTNAKLIVFNVGSSDSQLATSFEVVNVGGAAAIHAEPIHAAAFAELGPTSTNVATWGVPAGAGPDGGFIEGGGIADSDPAMRVESIPLRGSLRLRNITERYSVGGEVRMMRYNGGLFLGHNPTIAQADLSTVMGVAEFLDICDMMRDTKRATTFGADDLLTAHQMNTYPADSIRSHTFMSDTSLIEACLHPKFCTLIVLIDDFKSGTAQVNNTYSLNFVAQRAARFKPGSLLHHKAKLLPTNPGTHHKLQQQEATNPIASIVKGGVSATGLAAAASYAGGELGMLAKAAPYAAEMLPLLL